MKAVLRSARQFINMELEPLGITSAEGDILFHLLTGSNNIRQEQLATRLDIGKAAVSRTLDALEAKGYIKRARQPEDKRAYTVSLTDKASAIGADIRDVYEGLFAIVKKSIADEELTLIQSMLSRVAAHLQALGDR
jgi:MarR family transcriptional regulator for hemolysin